ncbi:hypothetical protein, partial [Burkholderia pseudomallei]|uniref:hypothetical protein n=1 Tax=Burkholderia pseudomallei TaxID=28450 RepID=UPI0019402846
RPADEASGRLSCRPRGRCSAASLALAHIERAPRFDAAPVVRRARTHADSVTTDGHDERSRRARRRRFRLSKRLAPRHAAVPVAAPVASRFRRLPDSLDPPASRINRRSRKCPDSRNGRIPRISRNGIFAGEYRFQFLNIRPIGIAK